MTESCATIIPHRSPLGADQSLFAISCAALFTLVVLLFPVAVAKYPALVDFPSHLARHYIAAAINGSSDLQKYYSYEWRPVGNMAADIIFIPLKALFSPLDSERIIIAIAIALWVIAPFILNRAIWGRWSIAPCLCGLIVYNMSLRGGLENFLIASALSVVGFALWILWTSRGLSVWHVIVFGVLASLVYFGHVLAFVVFGLLVGCYELQRAITTKGPRLTRLGRLAAAAAPFLPAIVFFWIFGWGRATGETLYGGLESRIQSMLSMVLMYHPLPDLFALFVLFGILAWRAVIAKGKIVHPSMVYVLLTLLLVSLLAPAVVQDVRGVHVRLPAILMVVLIASIDWRPVTASQWRVIGAAFFLALLLRSGSVTSYWLQHDREVGELRESFEKLERGSSVLAAVDGRADPSEFHWLSLLYAVLDRQIFTPSLYTDIYMLRPKPTYLRLWPTAFPQPVELSRLPPVSDHQQANAEPEAGTYWRTWWKDFSHILVLSREPIEPPFKDNVELISEGSFFRLYKIGEPRSHQSGLPSIENRTEK